MKTIAALSLIFCSAAVHAQQAPTTPQLSTADKVAIQSLTARQQELQNQFAETQKALQAIREEWAATHPGFRLSQQSYSIEPVPATTPEPKK